MESIEVDNDVFIHLQKHAQPFIDTPNSTLRRLLGIDPTDATPVVQEKLLLVDDTALEESPVKKLEVSSAISSISPRWPFNNLTATDTPVIRRSKAPKTDLRLLCQEGFLQNGQKLHLVNYQREVQRFSAIISDSYLIYNGKQYSMSKLAQKLLTQMGFKNSPVRGPAHWVTDHEKLVKDLWQQYLDRNQKS